MEKQWLPVSDIAARLKVSKDTAFFWSTEDAMPTHEGGGLWKLQASEIDDLMRASAAANSDETSRQITPMSVAAPATATMAGKKKERP